MTRLVLLPPHRDPSLVAQLPEGFEAVDLAAAFIERVSAPPALALAERRCEARLPASEALEALLRLRAARDVGERPGADGASRLRALGALLSGLSEPGGVRLRLDDLELPQGTTERGSDAARAAEAPAPYEDDLRRSLERVAQAGEGATLWLARDQELPATLWLAARWPAEGALALDGPFARRHWDALRRLPALARAQLAGRPLPLSWRVRSPHRARGWRWQEHPDVPGGAAGDGPWAGYVSLEALARAPSLLASGCRHAVVSFAALSRERGVLDVRGAFHPVAPLAEASRRLAEAGVPVIAEWWVGAPGVDGPAHLETMEEVLATPFFAGLAGLRRYHGGIEEAPGTFGGRTVTWKPGPLDHDLDLARSRPFESPGSLGAAELEALLAKLARGLERVAAPCPGRLAAAYLEGPRPRAPAGPWLRRDPDCALAELPTRLQGTGGATVYAVQLRTGATFAVEPRLARALRGLNGPSPVEAALGVIPAEQRERAVEVLCSRAVLERVQG